MGFATALGVGMGALSALSSVAGSLASGSQKRIQAEAMETNARNMRNQAKMEQNIGQEQAKAIDRRKTKIRRQYEDMTGQNRVQLGAGNVEGTSGSAMQVAEGNISRLAEDIGENAYQKAIKEWETEQQYKANMAQAEGLESEASYLEQSANNVLPTVLGGLMSGASGFMTGYGFGGGTFGNGEKTSWETNWDKGMTDSNGNKFLEMRHPSGWKKTAKIKI